MCTSFVNQIVKLQIQKAKRKAYLAEDVQHHDDDDESNGKVHHLVL